MTFRTLAARLLTAATLAAPLALPTIAEAQSPLPVENAAPMKPKQVTEIGLRGACWVLNGTVADHRKHGSGWVLDSKKRLIVTNDHVISGKDNVEIFFPVWEGGKVNRDADHYLKNLKAHKAVVIDRDKNRDLALLQVDAIPEGMKELKLASQPAEEGDLLRTVGALPNGNEALWGTVSGEVRLIAPRNHPNGGRCVMVTTTIPTNGGNSGGAILNDRGEIVAVVEGGFDGPNAQGRMVLSVTMHVDLSELKAFVEETLPLVEPADAAAFVKRGERRLNMGRVDQASADFSEAIKKDKTNVRAMLGRGKTFVAKGDHATAVGDFDDAIAADNQSFEAHIARGRARLSMKNHDDAIADMTKAIRIDPNSLCGYNERGHVHHNAGNYAAAVEDYTRAIKIAPNDTVLIANRAGSLEQAGKIDEAIADRKTIVELQPNADWQWCNLGRTYLWKAKRYEEAFSAFKKAAQLNTREPIHLANIGDTLLEDGQFAKAVAAFDDAFAMNRENATLNMAYTHMRRGKARKGNKDLDGAFADFSQAIKFDPKFVEAYIRRAEVLKDAGKFTEAQSDIDQAIKLDPSLDSRKLAAESDSKNASVVGTWEFNGTINGLPVYERATFRADGTVVSKLRTVRADGSRVDIDDSGTYEVVGDQLTVNLKQIGKLTAKLERKGDTVRATSSDGTVIPYTLVK
jgi:tetratricopeptide (TPR) repeat protein